MNKFSGKKVLVLGLSKSGISAAKFLNKRGAEVFITESREKTEKDFLFRSYRVTRDPW